jgi:glutathione synthase/RimK-type ligase-like ATP-grasp enzyme
VIALATCEELPALDPDDAALVAALRDRGLDPRPAVWSDPEVDWGAFDLCLIRSVWDYFHRPSEFLEWVDRAGAVVEMWNPPQTLRWNAHKSYLRELEGAGVPVIPTLWLEQGSTPDLSELLAERGWSDAILKPAVAGGSLGLHRVSHRAAAQEHLEGLLERGDAMAQPFLGSITGGELSIICLDGEPSHAVRKTPRAGDIRVQPEHGGLVERAEPDEREAEVARTVLAALPHPALYARVDLVRSGGGEPLLIELECIEPRLFLSHDGAAAGRVVDAVQRRLG